MCICMFHLASYVLDLVLLHVLLLQLFVLYFLHDIKDVFRFYEIKEISSWEDC
jgi:hypothetical protein